MCYYPELDSHVRDKVKELNDVIRIDTSNLATKRDFITLKAEVSNLDTYKLVNVPTFLSNLKAKLGGFDFVKWKAVPGDLKKLGDSKDVVKKDSVHQIKYKSK